MKVYCMRHGEAVEPDRNPERPLTDKGREDVTRIAALLAAGELYIPKILHSDKSRAIDTAKIMADHLPHEYLELCKIQPDRLDAVMPLCEEILSWKEDTLLVGHQPFLSYFVSQLVTGQAGHGLVHFAPGTIVALEHVERALFRITWMLTPGMVPALSQ